MDLIDRRAAEIESGEVTSLGHEYLDKVVLDFPSLRVSLFQDRNVMRDETGGAVWDAGIVLADYVVRHPELVRGQRVIEIGAGTGLVGCVAGLVQQSQGSVAVTDLPQMTEFIRRNLRCNRLLDDTERVS